MYHIVSWSGGKDSTFMLHEMLNRGMPVDEVVCCDIKDLYMLYIFYPNLWYKLREYDKKQNNRFRKDYSLQQLEDIFEEKSQLPTMLTDYFTKVSEPNIN